MKKKTYLMIVLILSHIVASFYDINTRFIMTDNLRSVLSGAICDAQDALYLRIAGIGLSCVFVPLFWAFWFMFFSDKTSNRYRRVFGIVFALWLIQIILIYPEMFAWENDNLGIYVEAMNGIPDFWHSYFTSAVYIGVLIAFRLPVMIPVLQAMTFSACFASFYALICNMTGNKMLRALSWLLVFHAGNFYVALMPYRNCFYTILLFFLFTRLLLYYDKGDLPPIGELAGLSVVTGICAFWRSEGLLLLIFLPLLLLLLGRKDKRLKTFLPLFIVVMAITYLVTSYPQKVAEKKYFGKDYMIVNVLAMLSDVMRDESFHTNYEGYEKDIKAVETLYDSDMIKDWRSIAFQFTNMLNGNHPNRSMATDKQQADFIRGSVRILLHNKAALVKGRIRMSMEALSLMPTDETWVYTTQFDLEQLDTQLNIVPKLGKDMLYEKSLLSSGAKEVLKGIWKRGYAISMSILQPVSSALYLLLFVLILILGVEMLLKKRFFFLLFDLYILGMTGIIVVFEPAAREAYYYPLYYMSVMLLLFYFAFYEKKEVTESGMQTLLMKQEAQSSQL